MPAYLSPIGNEMQLDANGNPLAGGQIWTLAAGTTSLIATYTDSAGLVPQANPIVLNSAGLPASPIWLPAGQAVKLEIKNSDGVIQRTVPDVSGINDPSSASTADQWVIFTGTPTYISATSFSLAGDQANTLQAGRRVKSANTGGTVYSTITASSYNAGTGLTTVTVSNDSGTLDAGLAQVSYGLLSASNPSIPYVSGQVLQEIVATDAGSSTTNNTLTNLTAAVQNITPKSSNSKLLIECSFNGSVTSGGAGLNTTGGFRLYNSTGASDIGAEIIVGTVSAAGANLQTQGACVVRATVNNTGRTLIGFLLRGRYTTASCTVSATNQVWTIREIQS
jgi:hypothetical protein